MIRVFIPSFNRPVQLLCLLRSLDKYWSWYGLEFTILCQWSNEKFKDGYNKLIKLISEDMKLVCDINFTKEVDFCRDAKELLNPNNKMSVSPDYTMLLTDDCVFYKQVPISPSEINDYFASIYNIHAVSFRIGRNTVIQDYQQQTTQYELDKFGINKFGKMLKYNFKHHPKYNNFGYAFSLDGQIYRSDFLYNTIKDWNWSCPRALEHQLNINDDLRVRLPNNMICPETSSLFVNTINRVQPNGPNAGTKHYYSPEELNDRWLSGQQIALQSFDGLELQSSHEEFPLLWENQL